MKPIKMNEPPHIKKEEIHIEKADFFKGYMPDEFKHNIKGLVIKGISIPAKARAPIMSAKLSKSDYVNKYLGKYLLLDNLASINDHLKFGLVYGINLFETVTMSLVQQVQEQQQTVKLEKPNELDSLTPSE